MLDRGRLIWDGVVLIDGASFGERRTKKGYIVYLKSTVELHARKTAKPVAPPNMRQPPEEFRDV